MRRARPGVPRSPNLPPVSASPAAGGSSALSRLARQHKKFVAACRKIDDAVWLERVKRFAAMPEPPPLAKTTNLELLEWHLARSYTHAAKRERWRPSELAMAMAGVCEKARELSNSATFRKLSKEALYEQVVEVERKNSSARKS